MDWITIRSAFIRHRGTRKQAAIAARGGLRQSDISKLEANDNLGPQVETFLKAIQGLGLQPSAFFAELEAMENKGLNKIGTPVQNVLSDSEGVHGIQGGGVPSDSAQFQSFVVSAINEFRQNVDARLATLEKRLEPHPGQNPNPHAQRARRRKSGPQRTRKSA